MGTQVITGFLYYYIKYHIKYKFLQYHPVLNTAGRGTQCRPMENKDIQAYLKHNQYIQANLDGMELPENFDPQTYEAHYEMSIKDQRKLPNYVFNFTLPNDIGKRRQKEGLLN